MDHGERELACAALPVPESMSPLTSGYRWARDTVGEAGSAVYRLFGKAGAPELFLKHGKGAIADDVTDEMVRLRWLASHLPAAKLAHFMRAPDEAWLLMTAVPGKTAYQMLESGPDTRMRIVDALAEYLRRFHAVPAGACPFNSDHLFRLAQAKARMDAGLVETGEFDTAREGWTAEQVWDAMHALLPLTPDPVVTHGDYSLDNVLIENGEVVGCIDVGRLGIADRYQDLAIVWNCLGEFDPALQQRFFQRYGIGEPDARKLEFHLMLDEFF